MGASIGPELAWDVRQALHAVLDWRLPPDAWDETGRLVAALGAAVEAGRATEADRLTAELETCGRRARRMGVPPQDPPAPDGKVPVPPVVRERTVALLHAVDPQSTAGRGGTGSAASGGPPPAR
ncbi:MULTISPECIES: CATRA system-associated protein [unclassified Streptomyces]|uniref:CATRA system-associated protein n=1 Tax=unclassified Streptomyces TaxID=2593676 RepID=UPI0036538CBB